MIPTMAYDLAKKNEVRRAEKRILNRICWNNKENLLSLIRLIQHSEIKELDGMDLPLTGKRAVSSQELYGMLSRARILVESELEESEDRFRKFIFDKESIFYWTVNHSVHDPFDPSHRIVIVVNQIFGTVDEIRQ